MFRCSRPQAKLIFVSLVNLSIVSVIIKTQLSLIWIVIESDNMTVFIVMFLEKVSTSAKCAGSLICILPAFYLRKIGDDDL